MPLKQSQEDLVDVAAALFVDCTMDAHLATCVFNNACEYKRLGKDHRSLLEQAYKLRGEGLDGTYVLSKQFYVRPVLEDSTCPELTTTTQALDKYYKEDRTRGDLRAFVPHESRAPAWSTVCLRAELVPRGAVLGLAIRPIRVVTETTEETFRALCIAVLLAGTYDAPVIIPLRNILAMQGSERVMQEVQRAMHALHGAGYTIEHIEDALLKKPYQIIVDPCSVKEGLWVDTTNPPFLAKALEQPPSKPELASIAERVNFGMLGTEKLPLKWVTTSILPLKAKAIVREAAFTAENKRVVHDISELLIRTKPLPRRRKREEPEPESDEEQGEEQDEEQGEEQEEEQEEEEQEEQEEEVQENDTSADEEEISGTDDESTRDEEVGAEHMRIDNDTSTDEEEEEGVVQPPAALPPQVLAVLGNPVLQTALDMNYGPHLTTLRAADLSPVVGAAIYSDACEKVAALKNAHEAVIATYNTIPKINYNDLLLEDMPAYHAQVATLRGLLAEFERARATAMPAWTAFCNAFPAAV